MPNTNLSQRGEEAASHTGENQIWDVLSNLYHTETNPDGFISLGVAENALMHNEMASFIESRFRVPHVALTYGDGPTGSRRVKVALARFLTKHLKTFHPIKPEHITITNGVTTVVENCAWALANPDDGFLLGQPYYRAFLADISLRPGAKVIPVPFGTIDPCGPECVSKYEEAILKSHKEGVKVKGLVLCHPHNPLGRCYAREVIIALMKLCQKYQIHFLSDEIYAFSVWHNTVDTHPPPLKFESVLSIDTEGIIDASLVHFAWGVSKDFGANGLRLGVLISQSNKPLLDACRTIGLYTYSSSLADQIVADLLEDDDFVDEYIQKNQQRLSEAYAFAVGMLQDNEIEYAKGANAAFFLWINLGKAYLDRHPEETANVSRLSFDGETDQSAQSAPNLTQIVFSKLMARRLFLANGDVTGAEEQGWFRLVFSQPRESLKLGLDRMIEAIS